jgi:D-amino peptidase
MKVLIAADMEGITGVVHWDHVDWSNAEYGRFRRLMTGDVNAAVKGAYDGAATEVVVADGHGYGRNILIEDLDPRAVLNSGSPSPLSMVQGIDSGVNAVMFVGYHARSGSQHAILDHTWSSTMIANVWLNGQLVGEIGLNAAVCGHYDAPVIMISGDQTACAEASALLGPVETAIVKRAAGRMAAACLPPAVTTPLIHEAAKRAMNRLQTGQAPQPLRVKVPVTITVELAQSEMADKLELLPGARRVEGKRVEFAAGDVPAAYAAFRAAVSVARA